MGATSIYSHVRRRGEKYEARPWIDYDHLHMSLGLYPSPEAARAVVREFFNRGTIPQSKLPKYVHRMRGGRFKAWVRIGGRTVATKEYLCPHDAHAAIRKELSRTFPKGLPKIRRR